MELVKMGILILAMGLTQAASAKIDVIIEVGGGRGGHHDGGWDRGDRGDRWDRDEDWGHPRRTICYARNFRGRTFAASGRGPARRIQRRAVEECRMFSNPRVAHTCRPVGCR